MLSQSHRRAAPKTAATNASRARSPSDGRGPGARREASTTPHGLHATEALGRHGGRRRAGAGPTRERAAALAERLAGVLRRPLHPGCERKISIEKNGDRVIAHFAGAGAASVSTPFISTKDRVDGVRWRRDAIDAPPSPRCLDGNADGVASPRGC